MTDQQIQKRILLRLANGCTTVEELKQLTDFFEDKYKRSNKDISYFIQYQSFNELLRRLQSSVFSDIGNSYPIGFRKYCIYGEYQNTKLFIKTTTKIFSIAKSYGNLTNPQFYNQPDPGYKISLETLVHIMLRHNKVLNSFINNDSKESGHNPSSFGLGLFTEPMSIMLMALNIITDEDWQKAATGKNLICHFCVGGQLYTLIRKGASKEILSFYPRNDSSELNPIRLKRNPNKMLFIKE